MKSSILRHIGLALLLMLPLWGCQLESLSPVDMLEGNRVRLKLDIDLPDYGEAPTRTDFVDTPVCTQLYVVVFDEADMLTEIAEATVAGSSFTVDLHPSALPRTLHFLALPAGSPVADELDNLRGAQLDEPSFSTRLATQNGDAACWARKVLTPGISADTDLSGIKMVRNYAKVYIRNNETETHFRLESFKVYNAANYGMVIPFNGVSLQNTGEFNMDLFPVFFDGSGSMRSYADVNGLQGYRGYPHPSGALRTPVTADADSYTGYLTSDGTDAVYDYIFETRYNSENGNDNPYILFKGKYSGTDEFDSASSTWYKADFVYADADSPEGWGDPDRIPYDILRNYAYVLTISGVIGEGHATPEYAASQPARNNFDGSVVGMDISGVKEFSSALYLSQTAIELPRNPDITYIDLYYRNENPKDSAPTNTPETYVRISVSGDTIINSSFVNGDGTLNLTAVAADPVGISEAIDASDASIAALHLKSGAWWHLRLPVTISAAESSTLQETITIRNKTGLCRHCVVSVRPHYPFEIVGYQQNPAIVAMESVEPVEGDVVRVNFRIPAGLPEAIFPLEFKVESYADGLSSITKQVLQPKISAIEAYELTLGAGDYRIELPVTANTNTIVGENANDARDLTFRSYHYTRTVTWTEYCNADTDAKFMKAFPVFLEPLYNPRDNEQVEALGTTTVWMRQGERGATYFSYKDDEDVCTRRYAYVLVLVKATRIVLPAGDATYDGKPVYEVPMDADRDILIYVVRDDTSAPTPNPLTLSKGSATQFSLDPIEGDGSITTTVSVGEVTGERYLVTAHAGTVQEGSFYYGESEAQFYIKPVKGNRSVTFPVAEQTILKNQTLKSHMGASGDYLLCSNLAASCPKLASGERLVYSLDPSSVVTSNTYVELNQNGSSYTLRGKAENGATSVKVYAIAEADANYNRAVAELVIHVKEGEITETGWWTDAIEGPSDGYVGVLIPITGTVNYDDLYDPVSLPFTDADISFTTTDPTVATVQKVLGNWYIVPRKTGTVTLTMHVPGTDDDGDGIYGEAADDVFQAVDFVQTLTVWYGWWKVLNNDIVSGDVYAISDSGDGHLMTTTSNSSEAYHPFGLTYIKDRYVEQEDFTPTSFGGGAYFTETDYGYLFTFSAGDNRYSIQSVVLSDYLFPCGHYWSVTNYINISGWQESDNNDGLFLNATEPSNRTFTCWMIGRTTANYTMEAWTGSTPSSSGKYIQYNSAGRDSKTYFDNSGSNTSYNHLWKRCSSIDDIVTNCSYSASSWPAWPEP